jgi:tRNA (adenine22-N1)-methyltransferase
MLSKRLTALVGMITGTVVADVGTDHAYLLCALADQQRLVKGYAMDIALGPLQSAKKNIDRKGYQQIELLLSDGLEHLPADVQTIVIAGMGRETIEVILSKHWERLSTVDQIIIQCNTQLPLFRKFLFSQGVTIMEEQWVHDKHDYQLISFHTKEKTHYSELEQYAGPILLKALPSAMINYYQHKYQVMMKWLPIRKPNQLEQKELALITEILKL